MRKLTLIFLAFPFFFQAQLSLEDCQTRARANYPLIKQFDLISKSTEYNVSNAGKMYLPQLSLTGIGAFILSGLPSVSLPGAPAPEQDKFKFIGMVQLNQTIWDGGATKTQKEIIKSSAEVEKAGLEVNFHTLKERVNQIYFGILLLDERTKTLNNNKEILSRTLNRIKVSQKNGLGLQSDADEIYAEELLLEQKLIELNYTRKAYLDVLSVLIGTSLGSEIILQTPNIIEINISENNRPERKLFQEQKNLFMAQSNISRVQNMPKFAVMGAGVMLAPGVNLMGSDLSSIAIAGLSLSWNTHNIYKTNNNKSLEKIQFEKIAAQEELFNFNTKIQLQQNSSEIEKQKAVLQKDEEIVLLKQKIRDAYQLKFDNGLCSVSEFLNSGTRLNEAQNNRSLHNIELMLCLYQNKSIHGN